LKIYLKENRGAIIAAKEPKCSRGGGGTPEHLQRDRERDHCRSSVAGGETTRRQGAGVVFSSKVAEREGETAAAGDSRARVVFSPEVAERRRRQRRGGSGSGSTGAARDGGRNYREKWRGSAREEERGCSFEP